MKRIWTVALLFTLLLSLAACGEKEENVAPTPSPDLTPVVEPTPGPTPEGNPEPVQEPAPEAESESTPMMTPATAENYVTDIEGWPCGVELGRGIYADLNGDGVVEDIVVANEEGVPNVTINGRSYTTQSRYIAGVVYYTNADSVYGIVDIDTADGVLELAVSDQGPSDDYTTSFFRFDGKNLHYLGTVGQTLFNESSPESNIGFDGAGTIATTFRLSVLQTWWADCEWSIGKEGILQMVTQDVYYVEDRGGYTDDGTFKETHTVLAELYLYADRDANGEKTVLPVGEEITLLGTDNEEWVLVRTSGGSEGWLHLDERGFWVETAQDYEYSGRVIQGLGFAD